MIKEFLTRPTVFPIKAEEPWRIVENLCESITLRDCTSSARSSVMAVE